MIKKIVEYITNLWYSDNIREDMNMKERSLSVFDIAHFFASKENMTHKKLQKLVYYAYAWFIALYNEESENIVNRLCVDTTFEAWVHGPVCRKLYDAYSNNYGMVDKFKGELNSLICGEIKKYLENIYKTFGKYTGDELESMTHQEMPWRNARDNLSPSEPSTKPILESDMFLYYNSL